MRARPQATRNCFRCQDRTMPAQPRRVAAHESSIDAQNYQSSAHHHLIASHIYQLISPRLTGYSPRPCRSQPMMCWLQRMTAWFKPTIVISQRTALGWLATLDQVRDHANQPRVHQASVTAHYLHGQPPRTPGRRRAPPGRIALGSSRNSRAGVDLPRPHPCRPRPSCHIWLQTTVSTRPPRRRRLLT